MTRSDYRNIEKDTLANSDYRRVVYTVPRSMQIVLMSVAPGEDIPLERHARTTQFIRVESGSGECLIGRKTFQLHDGTSITIPPGSTHRVINTSPTRPLQLYTIYTPPEHPANRRQRRQPKP